jgi:hypothetical protein
MDTNAKHMAFEPEKAFIYRHILHQHFFLLLVLWD